MSSLLARLDERIARLFAIMEKRTLERLNGR